PRCAPVVQAAIAGGHEVQVVPVRRLDRTAFGGRGVDAGRKLRVAPRAVVLRVDIGGQDGGDGQCALWVLAVHGSLLAWVWTTAEKTLPRDWLRHGDASLTLCRRGHRDCTRACRRGPARPAS